MQLGHKPCMLWMHSSLLCPPTNSSGQNARKNTVKIKNLIANQSMATWARTIELKPRALNSKLQQLIGRAVGTQERENWIRDIGEDQWETISDDLAFRILNKRKCIWIHENILQLVHVFGFTKSTDIIHKHSDILRVLVWWQKLYVNIFLEKSWCQNRRWVTRATDVNHFHSYQTQTDSRITSESIHKTLVRLPLKN